ncbi:THO complex subunit 6, partial [Modicella reniformis]
KRLSNQFQQAVITPFSDDQAEDYIEKYVRKNQLKWQASYYLRTLERIPGLKDLVRNPLLLSLYFEIVSSMEAAGQDLTATRLSKVEFPQAKTALENLSVEGFTQICTNFLKGLAEAIYAVRDGNLEVEYVHFKEGGSWKTEFFGWEETKQLLREACPLTRSGNKHRFIHRSLLEYGMALAVFDPEEWRIYTAPKATSGLQWSVSSIPNTAVKADEDDGKDDMEDNAEVDTEDRAEDAVEEDDKEDDYAEDVTVSDQEPILNSPLVCTSIVNDPSILEFLVDRVQKERLFKKQLWAYIMCSKKDEKWATAAANAITILIKAGVPLNGVDLQGIKISGADLSNGMFDSANLEGADMSNTNLRNIWLRQANLYKTKFTGARYGELPLISVYDSVAFCSYSPDGSSLTIGLHDGTVGTYRIPSLEPVWTSSIHGDLIKRNRYTKLKYSSGGGIIACSGGGGTVTLWNVRTGKRFAIENHKDRVTTIACSQQGHWVAYGSSDMTVRIWNTNNTNNGSAGPTLKGHEDKVTCVSFSPRGDQVASGSQDKTVRLWNVQTGDLCHILDHESEVASVTYSPHDGSVVSGGEDGTVRLWEMKSGQFCPQNLETHEKRVYSIVYSPGGHQIITYGYDKIIRLWDGDRFASSGTDKTVRLWDVEATEGGWYAVCSSKGDQVALAGRGAVQLWDMESGTCRRSLSGHEGLVSRIIFSPEGNWIASCGESTIVRVSDVETGATHFFEGHEDNVAAIAFSPGGDRIASGGHDNTVRLWDLKTKDQEPKDLEIEDVETKDCLKVFEDHTDLVHVIAFSPSGNQVASGSHDKTVRLWNVETEDRHILHLEERVG